ncbi:lipase family protein [Parapedobacter koreensis]|uniref:Pimeloyl-ACP methyl ester carboxylesterase n=1 Tax=Parapedobacter koreensis TaxID=332977 RepID=A0A1H7TJG9_9SPHI|nr:alpha/beta fold hydrolase [Parapedobacter koreensis]SEL85042.1 Pimeloyl-ACP methyl ester carboxylesterase [Parapedobacter koreensis]
MKTPKIYYAGLYFLIAGLFSSCSSDDDNPSPDVTFEYLISEEEAAQVSVEEIKARFPNPAAALLIASDVTAYRVTYKTQFPAGNPIEASGLVIIPKNKTENLTLLGFQHGTITADNEAPSSYLPNGNMEAYVAGTVGASLAKGYIVVMPDYIGYGVSSNIPHPYQEKASLAQASLDMLRAAKELAISKELGIRKEVRLVGYSEGGYATLALHQAIEESAADEFTVEASYPAAGAYDMLGTAEWVVSQNRDLEEGATGLYLWALVTYQQLYGINAQLTDILQPAAAQSVATAIAQGSITAAQLSNNPGEVFTPSFAQGIQQGTNTAFVAALQQNNSYDWKPNAPVVFFHALADDIVPVLNAQTAESTMKALGANVQFVPLGNIGHREGANAYIQAVVPMLIQ